MQNENEKQQKMETSIEETKQDVSKTYSEEEYLKLKRALDNANAEAKKSKDSLKAKMTEEEKLAEEREARELENQQIRLELRKLKLQTKLISGGFNEEETKKIIDLRNSDDDEAFAKYLVDIRNSLIESTTKSAREEFSKENYVPAGGSNKEAESMATRMAKKHNAERQNQNKALVWGRNSK